MTDAEIDVVMATARYEHLADGPVYGEIPNAPGAWAMADTEAECAVILREVFGEWLALGGRYAPTNADD